MQVGRVGGNQLLGSASPILIYLSSIEHAEAGESRGNGKWRGRWGLRKAAPHAGPDPSPAYHSASLRGISPFPDGFALSFPRLDAEISGFLSRAEALRPGEEGTMSPATPGLNGAGRVTRSPAHRHHIVYRLSFLERSQPP